MTSHPTSWSPSLTREASPVSAWRTANFAGFVAIAAPVSILLVALLLRAWGLGATFETSDQAAMAHMVCHSFGIEWIFHHAYGPVLPILQRGFAEVWTRIGLPYNEWAARLPVMLAGWAAVAMAYPLLRRLGRSYTESVAGMACVAILPPLVSDAHYAWGIHTIWLLAGMIALWATLAWLDDRRWYQGVLAAVALAAHCLSGAYAFAVPLALLAAWWMKWRAQSKRRPTRRPIRRWVLPWIMLFGLPCVTSLGVMTWSYDWTGGGQFGHLLDKQGMNAFGLRSDQIAALPAMWTSQLGIIAGVIAAGGLVFGLHALRRRQRIGLLAVWAWSGLVPFVLLANWQSTGYANYFMLDIAVVAGLLGVAALSRLYQLWSTRRVEIAMVALAGCAQLLLGSADVIVRDSGLHAYSSITTGWGDLRRDSGAKAAGFYVREHVPPETIVMCLHDRGGMEVSVAEYYLGRKVIAGYDLPDRLNGPLLTIMADAVDVVIAEPRHAQLLADLPAWQCVATFSNQGQPVRHIYARQELNLPATETDVTAINPLYDKRYVPRRIPLALPAPPGFLEALTRYQAAVDRLLADTRAGRPTSIDTLPEPGIR